MSPELWLRLKPRFEEAAALSGGARASYLASLRIEDPEMAEELESLLLADALADDPAEAVAAAAAALADSTAGAGVVGARLGAWRVTGYLASGGMGDVYLAARDDGEFDQRAAIKLLSAGFRSPGLLARFRMERQILAGLDHPHIAHVLDGGSTGDGVVWLAMEYIDGVPIDAWCTERELGVAARVRLFLDVCAAVEYAHRNLVVHRDIKPSNILVTADGTAKLLDFGIARLVDEAAMEAEASMTRQLMTPAYASPEQIIGGPITTASDIYALGVLLYELLTGRLPHDFTGLRPSEIESVVLETVPLRPSLVGSNRGAAPEAGWSRDLDSVVLKALRADPAQRYLSVEQLSADLVRYLERRPVLAKSQSWHYLAGKFIHRHARAVALAAILAAAALGGVVYHLASITTERDRVRAEAAKSAAVATFLQDVFRAPDPERARGESISAKDLLDAGRQRLQVDLDDDPATRAMLLRTVGDVYGNLGLYDEAIESLSTAVALDRASQDTAGLVASLDALGNVYAAHGMLEEAWPLVEEAMALAREHYGPRHIEIARLSNNSGHMAMLRGDYPAAQAMYEAAIEIHHALDDTAHWNYADTLHDLGQLDQLLGDLASAEARIREAIAIARGLLAPDGAVLSTYIHNLATVLLELGKHEEAEALFLEAIQRERQLLGEDHPDRDNAMLNLGALYQQVGRYEEAERLLRAALDHATRVRGERHQFVAYNAVQLARLLADRGEFDAAGQLFDDALDIYAESLSREHPYVASANLGYAAMLIRAGDAVQGELRAREGLDIAVKTLPEGHWLIESARSALGVALLRQGRLAEAEPLLVDSWRALEATRPGDEATMRAFEALAELQALQERGGVP